MKVIERRMREKEGEDENEIEVRSAIGTGVVGSEPISDRRL